MIAFLLGWYRYTIKIIFFLEGQPDFSYKDVDNWKNQWPECNGTKQSPINIKKFEVTFDSNYKPNLTFWNYEKKPVKLRIQHLGHTRKNLKKFPVLIIFCFLSANEIYSYSFTIAPTSFYSTLQLPPSFTL